MRPEFSIGFATAFLLCICQLVNGQSFLSQTHDLTDIKKSPPAPVPSTGSFPLDSTDRFFIGSNTASALATAACQTFLAELSSTSPAAQPAQEGWIDICPGDRVYFTGKGVYPQSGQQYDQSDLTTLFEWNFGDGSIAYGPIVSHRFDNSGGYLVQLTLTDILGCKSSNLVNQRIRVAPKPNFTLPAPINDAICAGDTLHLTGSIHANRPANLLVIPDTTAFSIEASRADSLALPDGTGIPYQTSLQFIDFAPGQLLTDVKDLESICVNMEHSYMRDLEIRITCPNGQNMVLHNFGGQIGGPVYLGIPIPSDGFSPIPGQGFDYCWTPTATNNTWLQYSNTVLGGSGTLPVGDYEPFQNFSNLLGCPLNGIWTITVTDLWMEDNGYIFSWSIKFRDELYANIESFTPDLISWGWKNQPSIIFQSQDSIVASPPNAGTGIYSFLVRDEFGCLWDTALRVQVLPFSHPACRHCNPLYPLLRDTFVCTGASVALEVTNQQTIPQEIRFESFPDYRIGNGNHPHQNPYASILAVNSLGYNALTNPLAQISSVCVDLETDFNSDITLALKAPDGKIMELSSGNGGSGDNYKIVCFSPLAAVPIATATLPFNGIYIPEGNWNSLTNSPATGNWSLLVSDGFGISQYGRVKWWSIGFNFNNSVNYFWSPAAGLTCNNCADPIATPGHTTTYTLTAIDALNCVHRDTVTLAADTVFPAPSGLDLTLMNAGSLTWSWDQLANAKGYEVSINNGPWIPANGINSHTLHGLNNGETLEFRVRASNNSTFCNRKISSASQVYIDCMINAVIDQVIPATCPETSTGSVIISVLDGVPPYSFTVNGTGPTFNDGNLISLFEAGPHFVVVRDSQGCRDTVLFVITEPDPIQIATSTLPATCNNSDDGSVQAAASGGTGAFTYTWQSCSGGAFFFDSIVSGLFGGCYSVTATDANGCSATQTDTINRPPPLSFTFLQDSVSCFGNADGTATVFPTGGTGPYSFEWSNGQTTATAINLPAGGQFVTLTDNNDCQIVGFVEVKSPPAIEVDSVLVTLPFCTGQTNGQARLIVTGGAPPLTYQWDDPQLQTTETATGLSSGFYNVTISDRNGCSTVAGVNIGSPAPLAISFSNVSAESCPGLCNGEFSLAISGGMQPFTFDWSGPGPLPFPTASSLCPGNYAITITDAKGCVVTDSVSIDGGQFFQVQLLAQNPSCILNGSITAIPTSSSSSYSYLWSNGANSQQNPNLTCGDYSVTVTNGDQCTASASITLLCPQPVSVTTSPSPAKCFGENSGSATAFATGGLGPFNFYWSDPNGQTGPSAIDLFPGTYTVTVVDVNFCISTATFTIGQPPPINLSVVGTSISCLGAANGEIRASAAGGTPPFTYLWTPTGPQDSIRTGLLPGQYFLTVVDNQGCSASAQPVEITEPLSNVSVAVTVIHTACFGQADGRVMASASGGNGNPYTFSWSNGQQGELATGLSKGQYAVTATDIRGCASATLFSIQEYDSIFALLNTAPPTCFGGTNGRAAVTAVNGGAGTGTPSGYSYKWDVPGAPDTSFLSNLAGNRYYFVTISDQEGCSNVFQVFLEQPKEIIPILDKENVRCAGNADGQICLDSIVSEKTVASWIWNDGSSLACITGLSPGPYAITVTDVAGCTGVATAILDEPSMLQLDLEATELLCYNDTTAMISTLPGGGVTPYAIVWSNSSATGFNPINLGPGLYSATLTDANLCSIIDSIAILNPPQPLLNLTITQPTCFGAANGRMKVEVQNGLIPLRYSINDGPFLGSPEFIGLKAGFYSIVVRDGNGCMTSISDTVFQPPPISIDLGLDTSLLIGDSLLIAATLSNTVGMPMFFWRSLYAESFYCQDSSFCDAIIVKPLQTNTYIAVVTDENGCKAQDEIRIVVEKSRQIFVPTAFSPNGHPDNRLLHVHGVEQSVETIEMFRVFDRWGELLHEDQYFQPNDYSHGWDGRFRGQECDPGVYVWYLEVRYRDGFRQILSGNTTLIR